MTLIKLIFISSFKFLYLMFAFVATQFFSFSVLANNLAAESTNMQAPCLDLYQSSFKLIAGKSHRTFTLPNKPVKNVPEIDSSFHTCRVRVTNFKSEPPKGFIRNDYSRRQPFNSDDSFLLTYAKNGYWHLYKTDNNEYYKRLNLGGGSVEPQWHPNKPNILFTLPNNGGLKMSAYDINRDRHDVIADFTDVNSIKGYKNSKSIHDIWPNAARVSTKNEGSPSKDARYWAFQVETSNFKSLGLITYDLQENIIMGVFDFLLDGNGIGGADHISMSPSGKFVVPSWHIPNNCPSEYSIGNTDEPCGLMVYTADFKKGFGITSRGPHSDIALNKNGNDVLVISNYITGYVEMYDLVTHEKTNLFSIYLDGSATAMHISGKAYNKPGWVLVSTYGTKKAPKWWSDKIFAVQLAKNPIIYNISHTYNTATEYWSEPHGVVNRDFTKIIFNSNWLNPDGDNEIYMIELPENAIN